MTRFTIQYWAQWQWVTNIHCCVTQRSKNGLKLAPATLFPTASEASVEHLVVQLLSHVPFLGPHGLQHTRLPCPSLSPRVCPNSCPLSRWCHPAISFSAMPFSFFFDLPASRSFPMSWLFASGRQRIGASASTSVLSMNIQGWFPLGWTDLISLPSKGTFKSLL